MDWSGLALKRMDQKQLNNLDSKKLGDILELLFSGGNGQNENIYKIAKEEQSYKKLQRLLHT